MKNRGTTTIEVVVVITIMACLVGIVWGLISFSKKWDKVTYKYNETEKAAITERRNVNGKDVVEFDGCEYLENKLYVPQSGGYNNIIYTHKGNCKFCDRRLDSKLVATLEVIEILLNSEKHPKLEKDLAIR